MVDTYLRPRPEFGTFLLSDTTADGDGLSFYKYKASLRKNRVSILQKKREIDVSEKVRVLEDYRRSLAHPNIDKAVGGHGNRTRHWTEPGYVPRPAERTVKSAGLRRNLSLDEATVTELQRNDRPKTAEHVPRDVSGQTESSLPKIGWVEDSTPKHNQQHPNAQLLESVEDEDEMSQKKLDMLAFSYQYGTTTQRSHNEVNWAQKLPYPVPIPVSTMEPKPDLVSVRLNIKRLESSPAVWQSIGQVWDYLQSRDGVTEYKQKGTDFCSPSRNTQQIPGYSGHLDNREMYDNPVVMSASSPHHVCTKQPHHTNTARQPNIPGYKGHVHWTASKPAHSNQVYPNPISSARVHRKLPLFTQVSPFVRTSPMSKMVSLNSPHNPFNKVEP